MMEVAIMSYDQTYTRLGEKIATVIGSIVLGGVLFVCMLAYQITM